MKMICPECGNKEEVHNQIGVVPICWFCKMNGRASAMVEEKEVVGGKRE